MAVGTSIKVEARGSNSNADGLVGTNKNRIENIFTKRGLEAVGSRDATIRRIAQTDITATTFTDAGWLKLELA